MTWSAERVIHGSNKISLFEGQLYSWAMLWGVFLQVELKS